MCLSYQHIAQLEGNQLVLFFTAAHKIQVAKKVGSALGPSEDDFLIYRATYASSNISNPLEGSISRSADLPENTDLFAKVGTKATTVKARLFIIPTLFAGAVAVGLTSQIYSEELSLSNLAQFISLKIPTPQLQATNPSDPAIEAIIAPATDAAVAFENEPTKHPILTNEESCAYQESDVTLYQTANPSKKSEMVYVLSKEHQSICVIDSQNKMASPDLET